MNETKAQRKETQPHSQPPSQATRTKDALGRAGRAGAELEPRPRSPPTFPLPARRPARAPLPSPPAPAPPPRRPLRALLTAPSWGSRRCQPGGTGSQARTRPGDGARRRSHPPPPAPKPLESLLGGLSVRAAAPLSRSPAASRCLPRPPPPRPLPAALQHGRARRPRTAPCAPRAGSPRPLGPRRGAALGVYRGPAARSPRPPPCALLTSFILSHPRPPTPFPNSDSPGRVAAAPAPAAVAVQGAEQSSTNRCDFLRRNPSRLSRGSATKGAGKEGLGRQGRLAPGGEPQGPEQTSRTRGRAQSGESSLGATPGNF